MGEKVTIPYHLVASPGSSGEVTLYEVPQARELRVTRIITYFPAGNYGELEVSYWVGIRQAHPTKGSLTGDNVVWDDEVDFKVSSGSALTLKYVNSNTTETREAFIHIEGELV